MTCNSSYRIYLTKNPEVARVLSQGWRDQEYLDSGRETKKIISRGSGPVNNDCRIPEIYHGRGLFYCTIEYKNGDTWDLPEYEIVWA